MASSSSSPSSSAALLLIVASLLLTLLVFESEADDHIKAKIDSSIAAVKKSMMMTSESNSLIVKSVCGKKLKDAIHNLHGVAAAAEQMRGSEGKKDMRNKAVNALLDVAKCDEAFGGSMPSPVKSALAKAKASIGKIIADM